MCTESRKLTDDEIKCFARYRFQTAVLDAIRAGREVKFLALRKKYNLIEIKQVWANGGEWELGIGSHHYYTYKLSDVLDLLDKIFDTCQIVSLAGEIELPK